MRTWIQIYIQSLLHTFWLSIGEPQGPVTQKGGLPAWAIILIVVLAISVCLIIVAVCIIAILALMGPAIGNVFSNVLTSMPTPMP